MKRFANIRKAFAKFGSRIKEASVELATRLLDIVKKDIPSDLAEENTTSNSDNITKTAIDAVASIIAIAVVAVVTNMFRKIK